MAKHGHRPGRQRPANPKRVKRELKRTGYNVSPRKAMAAQTRKPTKPKRSVHKPKAGDVDILIPAKGAKNVRRLRSKSQRALEKMGL